jgi:4-hydroxy-2-oxoheptanedioate aldolase
MHRINRAVALLASGKPVFAGPAGPMTEENGRRAASSWADWLIVELEHRPYDIAALAAFMRGYAEAVKEFPAGVHPPGIGVTLPFDGIDSASVRANGWIVKQVLATGAHGVTLCHAEDAGAVRTLVEMMRYADRPALPALGLGEGRRGHGAQDIAAAIWDMAPEEYIRRADLWRLDPAGELLLGLKVENPRAMEQAEAVLAVPGVAFAEWGPADMSLALGIPGQYEHPRLHAPRDKVKQACARNGVAFLHHASTTTVAGLIDEGIRFISCTEEVARIGRAHVDAFMPAAGVVAG